MAERDIAAEVLQGLREVGEHRSGKRALRTTPIEAELSPEPPSAIDRADGRVVLRPASSRRVLVARRLREARGIAGPGMSTDEVMRLTRGDE